MPALGALPAKLKPATEKGAVDFRKLLAMAVTLGADIAGVFERRSGGALDDDEEISLIFGGTKPWGTCRKTT